MNEFQQGVVDRLGHIEAHVEDIIKRLDRMEKNGGKGDSVRLWGILQGVAWLSGLGVAGAALGVALLR